MSNIIRAVFEQNSYTATATRADEKPIWQWNYGQILQLHGLDLPKATEVHFSHSNISGDALIRIGTTTDKITEVAIPETFLEHSGKVTAYVYCSTVEHGQTEYKTYFRVEARAKPEAWDKPEDAEIFHEAIEAVNEAADRAETAAGNAEVDAGRTAEDRAEVETLAVTVAEATAQAAKAAEDALQSEKDAGLSQDAAEVAQGQAEVYARQTQDDAAKTAADRVATGQDREAVAHDKTVASDAAVRSEAAESRVEEMLSGAEATITGLQDATAEGNTATSNLNAAIKTARESNSTLTDTVAAADTKKQEVDGSIATATVNLDSLTQQNATAATNIEALRSENFDANEILTAVGEIKKYANAITGTAQGTTAVIHDTWAAPILDLGVCGKSVQESTTGAQLLNLKAENIRNNNGLTAMLNEDGSVSVTGTPLTRYGVCYTETMQFETGTYYVSTTNKTIDGNLMLQVAITRADDTKFYVSEGKFEVKPDDKQIAVSLQSHKTELTEVNERVYLMINSGTTPLPWEPYTGGKPSPSIEYPQEVKSVGDNGSVEVVSSVGSRNLIAQSLLTRGAYLMSNGSTFSDLQWFYTHYINVGNNTQTVCSGYSNLGYGPSACFYDSNKNYITGVSGNHTSATAKLTIPDNAAYIRFSGMIKDLPTIKLEFGNKITSWTPAPEDITPENAHQYRNLIQPVTIPLTEPRGGTGKYADRICKQDGMWGIERQCIESAPITIPSGAIEAGSNTRKVSIANVFPVKAFSYEPFVQLGFSTHFKSSYGTSDTPHFYVWSVANGGGANVIFYVDTEDAVENVVVVAVRMTPVFEPFNDDIQQQLNALESYGGTTVMYTTDPMEPEVTFTCVKDSNKVIENIETQHAEDIIDLQAQIDALTARIG